MRKSENLGSVRKVDPCLRIFWQKTGPIFKDFLLKSDRLERHIPVRPNM